MNPNILEETKNKHLRSAADQVRALFGEVKDIYSQIENIQTELDLKVNLRSKKLLDGTVNYSVIGSGSVSASGFEVIGTNTSFTTECVISDQIKIGTETKTILTITDNTHLTIDNVSPATAFTSTYTDQVYAFIRPATRERLIGEFEFGQTNGTPFNGAINQGSVLTHAGRMTNPLDVVNINFVQKSVGPAMSRAINSIKRDGDIVGPTTVVTGIQPVFYYTFQNCDFTYTSGKIAFKSQCEVTYEGPCSDDLDIVNLGILKQYTNISQMYANWNVTTGNLATVSSSLITVGSDVVANILAPSIAVSESHNLNEYFDITSGGLVAKKNCIVHVDAGVYYDYDQGGNYHPHYICGVLYRVGVISTLISKLLFTAGGDSYGGIQPIPIQGTVKLAVGDKLVIGCLKHDTSRTYFPDGFTINQYCHLVLLGDASF